MKTELRNTARIEILNYITVFCTRKYFGENSFSMNDKEHSFVGDHFGNQSTIPIGSLVSLQSAPFSKYYLSWLKEVKIEDSRFRRQFLLESIEDGSLCWWSNVSIFGLPKETTDKFPEWKWTDKQFAFKKRWFNACYKKRDAYITLPMFPIFADDGSVILKTRERYHMSDYSPEQKFDDWKKVTVKDMLDFYDKSVSNKPKAVLTP